MPCPTLTCSCPFPPSPQACRPRPTPSQVWELPESPSVAWPGPRPLARPSPTFLGAEQAQVGAPCTRGQRREKAGPAVDLLWTCCGPAVDLLWTHCGPIVDPARTPPGLLLDPADAPPAPDCCCCFFALDSGFRADTPTSGEAQMHHEDHHGSEPTPQLLVKLRCIMKTTMLQSQHPNFW
ncbi:uncharacterized protein LOC126003599 isoform X2 [Suncus etruscus]|uniref:uncharacterized protein LOC126003599 isoform X2 n=1 Tax=Suncus etruscus TaxID=109475 RepID=UPI00210F3DB6|nr:uncharacterized protein LOC126003599 isoform X2 [Suncus etruscus]XP_049625841.1 uncharacterized protein LOC126003599 isoform X2 [Suncus etruscus]